MRIGINGLQPITRYAVEVRTIGSSGAYSPWSQVFTITTVADNTIPSAPTGLAFAYSEGAFVATWSAPTTNTDGSELTDFQTYQLELTAGGITRVITLVGRNYSLSFEENAALFGSLQASVSARVRAIDTSSNSGQWSNAVVATVPVPSAPTNGSGAGSTDAISLRWEASSSGGVTGYRVYVGSSQGFTPSPANKVFDGNALSYTFNTTTYSPLYFKVRTVNRFMMESTDLSIGPLTPLSPFGVDATAPGVPSSLGATIVTSDATLDTYAVVSWVLSSPPTDLAGYVIRYRPVGASEWSVENVGTDDSATAQIVRITKLTPYVNYEFQVASYDYSANYSSWSDLVTATAPANTAPSTPAIPSAAANTMQIQVSLSGNKSTGTPMEPDVVFYEVYASSAGGSFTPSSGNMLGQIPVGPAMVATFNIPANSGSGTFQTWYVRVIAVDRGGLKSPASAAGSGSVGLISTANIADAAITNAKIQSLSADKLVAGAGIITDLTVKSVMTLGDSGSNGVIQSYDYVAGSTGFKLQRNSLEINQGTIKAAALAIQTGENLVPATYADFEVDDTFYVNGVGIYRTGGGMIVGPNSSTRFNSRSLGTIWGTNTQNPVLHLAPSATSYNIPVDPNTDYIFSGYFWCQGSVATNVQFKVKWSDGTTNTIATSNLPGGTPSSGAQRLTGVVKSPAAATKALLIIESSTLTGGAGYNADGLQVEKKTGTLTTPSSWRPPGATIIDGGMVRTGAIRSTATVNINDKDEPAWVVPMDGSATFANLLIRGNAILGQQDPTTGAGDGAASTISSSTYVPGETGWQLRADGTGEIRTLDVDSLDGRAIRVGTLDASSIMTDSFLAADVTVTGALHAEGPMGEDIGLDARGFHVLGSYQLLVTNAALTAGIATITTNVEHGFTVGNPVSISVNNINYDGDWVIESIPSATTFTYSNGTANTVASTSVNGLAKSVSGSPSATRPTLVDFPTDGRAPNVISGVLTADTLSVTSGATLRGNNFIDRGATLTMTSDVQPPKSAPGVSMTYNQKNISGIKGTPTGITKGHNGNYFISSNESAVWYLTEHSFTSGAFVAVRVSGPRIPGPRDTIAFNTFAAGVVYAPNSGKYYMSFANNVTDRGLYTQKMNVNGYDTNFAQITTTSVATRSRSSTGSSSNDWNTDHGIGWDFVNSKPITAYHNKNVIVTNNVDINTTTGLITGTSNTKNLDGNGIGNAKSPGFITRVSNFDGVVKDRIIVKNRVYGGTAWSQQFLPYNPTSTGTPIGPEQWLTANAAVVNGGYFDSTNGKFYSISGGTLYEYQTGDSYWNASPSTDIRYVAYSFYDSVGTTHETPLSPAYKLVLTKRAGIKVTTLPIPRGAGMADDPDSALVYVADSDTQPSGGSATWKHRETIYYPSNSVVVTPNAAPAGKAPVTTNSFVGVGGNPAQIVSSTGNSFWKSDDTAQFYALVLSSLSDVNALADNKPALRIGNPEAGHLRLDGNEIQSMSSNANNAVDIIHLNANGGEVRLAKNGTATTVYGYLDLINPVTGSFTANANINSLTGRVRLNTSSKRFKENISPAELDTDLLLKLEPRTFQRNDERTPEDEFIGYREDNPWHIGFVAEEAEELGLKRFVEYDKDGKPFGFDYLYWTVALQAIAQKQQTEIEELRAEIQNLKKFG